MTIGFDSLNVNQELLLDLQFRESTGINTQDFSKVHRVCTLIGTPTWQNLDNGLPYLDFVLGNPDYILSLQAATTDLDFTSGDFSVAAWIRPDALGNRNIFTRGVASTDGWDFYLFTDGSMILGTNQAAARQVTFGTAADVAIGTWVFVSASRSGASARIYTNGIDTTATPATHINPLTANRNLYIGVNDLAGAAWYDGDLAHPRIWGRQVPQAEFLQIFQMERHLFGV